MTEQSRQEFEKWFKTQFPVGVGFVFPAFDDTEKKYIQPEKRVDLFFEYEFWQIVDLTWLGWQASRAAVVVGLPSVYDDAWDDQRMGYNIGLELCRETIEAQGLTVK